VSARCTKIAAALSISQKGISIENVARSCTTRNSCTHVVLEIKIEAWPKRADSSRSEAATSAASLRSSKAAVAKLVKGVAKFLKIKTALVSLARTPLVETEIIYNLLKGTYRCWDLIFISACPENLRARTQACPHRQTLSS
jgi:hypothetical protein